MLFFRVYLETCTKRICLDVLGGPLLTFSYSGGMVGGSPVLGNFCHVAQWVRQMPRGGNLAPPVSFVALSF